MLTFFLSNLYSCYYEVYKTSVDDEVHITRDANYADLYDTSLLIASRDVQGPIFMGMLSGGNGIDYLNGVKLLPIVMDENKSIIIKDSTWNTPLILTSTYGMVKFNIIPCGLNPKNNFKIEVIEKQKV